MPKRIQISTNIDPDIKHRLELLQIRTGWTFRKTLEEVIEAGLARMEMLEDGAERGREEAFREWAKRQRQNNST